MFTKLLSKPIFRLSVVILVNENILRATPVLAKDVKPRNFARWSARKPSKVFTTDEISSAGVDTDEFFKSEFGNTDNQDKDSSQQHKGGLDKGADKNPKKGFEKVKEKQLYPPWKTVHSAEGTDYVVLEEHDFTFSKMMTHVGNRNMRRKHDLMMLEGKRLNNDALKAGLVPKKIFFTQKNYLQELNLPSGLNIPLFKLPYKTVKLWSKLDMPPGIIGFYGIPKEEDINTSDTIPVKVLCDNVRDPGNMGSIIRVAASVGCTQVILMKGQLQRLVMVVNHHCSKRGERIPPCGQPYRAVIVADSSPNFAVTCRLFRRTTIHLIASGGTSNRSRAASMD
ncbi:rRNA (guanosine-2'-O-)-methyltransferase activity protein [Homalodisca vitripennis]|nr:rRNA (guanosine-2'-O-)-methyltransferase activity protein [Homalodisca vitripennis]